MSTLTDSELVERFGDVVITEDNKAFYAGWLNHELVLNRCADCRTWHAPPGPVCPECWSSALVPTPVSGKGTVYLLIWLRQGPPADGVDYATPHPVATVELDEQPGLRYTSTVTGVAPGELAIGDRVDLAWTVRAGAPYPVFVPAARH